MEKGFAPVYDERSKVLVLGSFPSVLSRAEGFYYGNPRNRFWKVLSALYRKPLPESTAAKREFLLGHGIALWDVADTCDVTGSSDASLRNVRPNDVAPLVLRLSISRVYANGGTAARLYRRFILPQCGVEAVTCPRQARQTPRGRLSGLWMRGA